MVCILIMIIQWNAINLHAINPRVRFSRGASRHASWCRDFNVPALLTRSSSMKIREISFSDQWRCWECYWKLPPNFTYWCLQCGTDAYWVSRGIRCWVHRDNLSATVALPLKGTDDVLPWNRERERRKPWLSKRCRSSCFNSSQKPLIHLVCSFLFI